MNKILITREAKAAKITAKKYSTAGWETIIAPLIEIKRVKFKLPWEFIPNFIIITSYNAAKIIAKHTTLLTTSFIVVGQKSAHYLSKLGYIVDSYYLNSDQLLENLDRLTPGLKFLYFCGDHISIDIVARLGKSGHNAKKIIIYKSIAVNNFNLNILQQVSIITFYSLRTAKIFAKIIEESHTIDDILLKKIVAVTLSPRIANSLNHLNFKDIYVSEHPTEESMLKTLKRL